MRTVYELSLMTLKIGLLYFPTVYTVLAKPQENFVTSYSLLAAFPLIN